MVLMTKAARCESRACTRPLERRLSKDLPRLLARPSRTAGVCRRPSDTSRSPTGTPRLPPASDEMKGHLESPEPSMDEWDVMKGHLESPEPSVQDDLMVRMTESAALPATLATTLLSHAGLPLPPCLRLNLSPLDAVFALEAPEAPEAAERGWYFRPAFPEEPYCCFPRPLPPPNPDALAWWPG